MLTEAWQLLGVSERDKVARVRAAYLTLAAAAHPDAGGDVTRFTALRQAYDEALQYAKNAPCPHCDRGTCREMDSSWRMVASTCCVCHGTGKRG